MDKFPKTFGDEEIFHLADFLLLNHGLDAAEVATRHAKRFFRRGDIDGYRAWMRIVLIVDGLFAMGPPEGANVH